MTLKALLFSACVLWLLSGDVLSEESSIQLCRGEMHETYDGRQRAFKDRDVVNCVFKHMQLTHETVDKPWLRCVHESENGLFSGAYPLSSAPAAQRPMQASDPLAIEKWYWMSRDVRRPISQLRFAAIEGSNQYRWLHELGYQVTVAASSVRQMFDLLDHGRVDAIVGTDEELDDAQRRGMSIQFVRYLPLRVFFSDDFLQRNPGFLAKFNRQINDCQPDNWVALSAQEHDRLANLALEYKGKIRPHLIAMLKRHNAQAPSDDLVYVKKVEALWQEDSPQGQQLRASVLQTPAADLLRQIKAQSQGLIDELFVMDHKGFLVASSDLTSDYWQGDEDKFQRSFGRAHDEIFVDRIGFDASTRTFQSQVSIPLKDEDGRADLGVVMMGLNIEKALSLSPLESPP